MKVQIFDQQLLELIQPDDELEQLATGFQFTEGPVWHADQKCLYFSDIIGNCLYRWTPEIGAVAFREPSNKANGNALDHQGRLLTCEHSTSRVVRTAPNEQVDVLVSHFLGEELNSPNDIIVKSDGSIYFTDPNSGRNDKYGIQREQQLSFQGVYQLSPSGILTLLEKNIQKPNGLCFSLDEEILFVDDMALNNIRAYDVNEDGTLLDGRVWAEMKIIGKGVADGMKIDRDGNLYCAGPGGIHVFAADARYLGIIEMPEQTANLNWGGPAYDQLFITASTSLYRIMPLIPGPLPGRNRG